MRFSIHVPDSYDGSVPYALYVACPGWEGLYFQGVGANLREDYPFVANDYIADMIGPRPSSTTGTSNRRQTWWSSPNGCSAPTASMRTTCT